VLVLELRGRENRDGTALDRLLLGRRRESGQRGRLRRGADCTRTSCVWRTFSVLKATSFAASPLIMISFAMSLSTGFSGDVSTSRILFCRITHEADSLRRGQSAAGTLRRRARAHAPRAGLEPLVGHLLEAEAQHVPVRRLLGIAAQPRRHVTDAMRGADRATRLT
jgi:hypothetical protein